MSQTPTPLRRIIANDSKTYLLPKNPVWYRCILPESTGWYPASEEKNVEVLRFFDGQNWSLPLSPDYNAIFACLYKNRTDKAAAIQWAAPWWTRHEQARLQAIDQAIANSHNSSNSTGMLQTTQQTLAALPSQSMRPVLEQGTQLFATKTCTAAVIQHAPANQKIDDLHTIIGQLTTLYAQLLQGKVK